LVYELQTLVSDLLIGISPPAWELSGGYSNPSDGSRAGREPPITGLYLRFPSVYGCPGIQSARDHLPARRGTSNWLVNKAKVEPKTVQGILRHSKIQTTLDLYTQEDSDETRAAQGEFLNAVDERNSELKAVG
jgi:hypothetical protein